MASGPSLGFGWGGGPFVFVLWAQPLQLHLGNHRLFLGTRRRAIQSRTVWTSTQKMVVAIFR